MSQKISNEKACRVLVFNPLKRLIGIFQSITATAKTFNTSATNIHNACNGGSISCCGLYFRILQDDIELSIEEDLGKLGLIEYDELCGIKRKYYPNKAMNRIGMKYNKNGKIED